MLRAALIRFFYLSIMFLAGLVLSNLALPERFGGISLLILNASFFSLVTGLGSDSLVLYKVSSGQWTIVQAFQFAWRTISIQIILFLAFELGSWFFVRRTFLSAEGLDYLAIEIVYFLGLIVAEKYISLFYAFHKAKLANILLMIVAVTYLLLLLMTYYFIKIGIIYVFYLFAAQSLVQALVLVVFFGMNPARKVRLENQEFLKMARVSSIVMVTNVIQLFVYRVDFWLLKYFHSNYEVGVYAQANKFANLSWIIPNILAQLLLPRFATMDQRRAREIFGAAFYFNLILVLATVLCTQFFYLFYLKAEYREGLMAFYLMLPGYFFWGSVIYFGAYVSSTGKFAYNLIGSASSFVLILFADLVLIPFYGMKGAAIANSICYTAVFFIYIYILTRKLSFSLKGFWKPHKKTWSEVIQFVTR